MVVIANIININAVACKTSSIQGINAESIAMLTEILTSEHGSFEKSLIFEAKDFLIGFDSIHEILINPN
jgi:hypothetical protein